jgi:ATP-dependent Clp protease ATP-binding subunit ClpA
MSLSPSLATLLDDARAEAKRAGHGVATPLHLAVALSRRAPEAFEAAFGAGSSARLRQHILQTAAAGTEADTVALLQTAGSEDPAEVIAALRERLGELGASADAPGDGQAPPGQPAAATAPSPPAPAHPHPPPAHDGRLLERVAPDASIQGFDLLLDELVALLSMRTPATPLVHGSAGAGKSSVASALAARLADPSAAGPLAGSAVMRLATAAVLSEDPIAALDRALDAQQPTEIVVVDDVESLLSLGSSATILPMLARLRGAAADPQRRLLLTIDDAYMTRLEAVDEELRAALTPVEVPALTVEVLWELAREQGRELSAHHGVALDDQVVRMSASPRASLDRRAHPGLLCDRLDRACSRAALRAEKHVREEDLGLAAPEVAPLGAQELFGALRQRVRGQDGALEPVTARLALTRARLDLRPERPDGVFLFVGPTGVGKTELARALCEQLFGSEDRLVRLDMSEYAEPWALARLIGPQPGYVGFTEPDAWLTTRIRKQPETVLLLDEIEKAHPTVWNAFLQVFDAGRLSDARGNVAHFARTVIAMTSNLGGRSFESSPIGFSPQQDDTAIAQRDRQRVLEAVKQAMSAELINRLDEIVVFAPLSPEAIEEIARLEVTRLCARLAERGYVVSIPDDVVTLIATTGYDPAYGARHLQRNVERLLLEPLASVPERELTAEVREGRVHWHIESPSGKPRRDA